MNITPRQQLAQGAETLGCTLNAEQLDKLMTYLALLQQWNQVFNLTAIDDVHAMVILHLLDSLSAVALLQGPNLLDIGTGAGLPGIPLAIARPELAVVLLDSNRKKTRFLTQAVIKLGLKNVEVVAARVEDYAPPARFATVTARAFAALDDFVSAAKPLCAERGQLLALRGKWRQDEAQWRDNNFFVDTCRKLQIPGLDAERTLICLRPLIEAAHG